MQKKYQERQDPDEDANSASLNPFERANVHRLTVVPKPVAEVNSFNHHIRPFVALDESNCFEHVLDITTAFRFDSQYCSLQGISSLKSSFEIRNMSEKRWALKTRTGANCALQSLRLKLHVVLAPMYCTSLTLSLAYVPSPKSCHRRSVKGEASKKCEIERK